MGMQPTQPLSPALFRRSLRLNDRLCSIIGSLLILSFMPNARAAGLVVVNESSQSLAFARYIASLQNPDPFERAGPVALSIEASLPGLYKDASLLAIRNRRENGRPKYYVLALEGDGTVLSEAIARYLEIEQQAHSVSAQSAAISPANYKFLLAGEVSTETTPAYIYRITPKTNRPGLLRGQVWIDSGTGTEVMLTGRVAKLSLIGRPAKLVRETSLLDGSPYARVTHLAFVVPNLGCAELVITEYLLESENGSQKPEPSLGARTPIYGYDSQ